MGAALVITPERRRRRFPWLSLLVILLLILVVAFVRGGFSLGPVTYQTVIAGDCDGEAGRRDAQCFDVFFASTRALGGDNAAAGYGNAIEDGVDLGRAEMRVPFILPDDFRGQHDRACFDITPSRSADYEKPACQDAIGAAMRIAGGRQILGDPDDWEIETAGRYFDEEAANRKGGYVAKVANVRRLTTDYDLFERRVYARWLEDIEAALNPERPAVLLYVHGFNTSFESSLETLAHLTADMSAHANSDIDAPRTHAIGVPVVFSWPTLNAGVTAQPYWESQFRAEADAKHFMRLAGELARRTSARELNIVAHSMGNRVLARSLHQLHAGLTNAKGEDVTVRIVYAAADLSQAEMDDIMGRIPQSGAAGRVRSTFYVSSEDGALSGAEMFTHTLRKSFANSVRDPRNDDQRRRARLAREGGIDLDLWARDQRSRVGHTRSGTFVLDRDTATTVDASSFETDGGWFVTEWLGTALDHNHFEAAPMLMADMSCALRGMAPDEGRSLVVAATAENGRPVWQIRPEDEVEAQGRTVDDSCTATGQLYLVRRKDQPALPPPPVVRIRDGERLVVYYDVNDTTTPRIAPVPNDVKGARPDRTAYPSTADAAIAAFAENVLADPINSVVVEGCADRSGETGRNTRLARARAENLRQELIAEGLDPGDVAPARGLGECPPSGPDDRNGRYRNATATVTFRAP